MPLRELIAKKRDGGALSADEVGEVIAAVANGAASDAQTAAFVMAVFIRGMSVDERAALTAAMRDSGEVLRWDLPGPVVDKHSTGGVGDNVSLMLAPTLAACGAYVPMISGRGLGHTGGTLDKLDAIPGYVSRPDAATFRSAVAEAGCAITGQTGDLAPADGRLYAIRDETGTVESIDLITASILSKKLAAGLGSLTFDVKCGSGAFMASRDEAQALARALVDASCAAGCPATALITDMNEPLASVAGNALEVANACAFLTGCEVDARLWDVTVALCGEALALSGLASTADDGARRAAETLQSGEAAERFGRMVAALGGPADLTERWLDHLPAAPVVRDVAANAEGFVEAIDARALGLSVVELGGGRRMMSDAVDPSVGFDQLLGLGAAVDVRTPLGRVHAATPEAAERASAALRAAVVIGPTPPDPPAPVLARIEA